MDFSSLATYESGLNTLNHMMFHNTIDGELPEDTPTLSEYIKRIHMDFAEVSISMFIKFSQWEPERNKRL